MLYRYLLVVLGLNQTLVLAFIPELSRLLGLSNSEQDLGLLTLVLNLNLLSYWFGVKYWGNKISPNGLLSSTRLAVGGFVAANLVFYCCLYASDSPSLIALALSRLLLGSLVVPLLFWRIASLAKQPLGSLRNWPEPTAQLVLAAYLVPVSRYSLSLAITYCSSQVC